MHRQNRAHQATESARLLGVSPVLEWISSCDNNNTRDGYSRGVADFSRFLHIDHPKQFRTVKRAHILQWRKHLESRGLAPSTVQRQMGTVSILFDYLCKRGYVSHNPCHGVKRPSVDNSKVLFAAALKDEQARALLGAPHVDTPTGTRDCAILATLLYLGLRSAELCALNVTDQYQQQGVRYFRVTGWRRKIRHVPINPVVAALIAAYLGSAGHNNGALFRTPVGRRMTPALIYKTVKQYGGCGAYSLRATAATNALKNGADLAEVEQWMGYVEPEGGCSVRPEDSPSFKVKY